MRNADAESKFVYTVHATVICNFVYPDIIYTTLCLMQQIYYIHNGSNSVVYPIQSNVMLRAQENKGSGYSHLRVNSIEPIRTYLC